MQLVGLVRWRRIGPTVAKSFVQGSRFGMCGESRDLLDWSSTSVSIAGLESLTMVS